jgi:phosphotransferase system enzyme I (PtsP)
MSDLAVHIHPPGDARVDGILRLIEIAGEDTPLAPRLGAMCSEIAAMTGVDVVSVYMREDDGAAEVLVMRGNHGFPPSAIGVRLAIGEGLTGLCASCLRPVSVAVAAAEQGFKPVPGLGEERFPAYVGVPLLGGGRAIGVLVLQRRAARAFSAAEVALATALGAPVTLALERSGHADRQGAPRSARLDGDVVVPGAAVARASVLPNLAALDARRHLDIARGLDRLPGELERVIKRIRKSGDAAAIRALAELELLWLDARLRERLAGAAPTVAGLTAVAREYARAPFRIAAAHGGDASTERADEIEDLLVVAAALSTDEPWFPPGAIWVSDRLGGLVALLAAARDAGALICAGTPTVAAVAIAAVEARPLLAGVRGLHAWIRPAGRCAVDAGPLWVNPSASAIERARQRRAG